MKNIKIFKTLMSSIEVNSHWFLLTSLLYFLSLSFKSGFVHLFFIILVFLSLLLILFFVISQFWNWIKCYRVLFNSPISLMIGALGSGKTISLVAFSEFQKQKSVYSNVPIWNNSNMIGFNHLKGSLEGKYKLPLPPENSFLLLDEVFLYLSGNDPKLVKKKWKSLIPTFLLARQYGYNMVLVGQRFNQHWVEYREIANLIIKPVMTSKPTILKPFFKVKYLAFTDPNAFSIYETESIKRLSNGEKVKMPRTSELMGVYSWTLKIPLRVASLYNTKGLNFVRDIKNNNLKNLTFEKWGYNSNRSLSIDDLMKYGMDNLIDNLDYEVGKEV